MQFITLLAQCQLCYIALPTVKMCDKECFVMSISNCSNNRILSIHYTMEQQKMTKEDNYAILLEQFSTFRYIGLLSLHQNAVTGQYPTNMRLKSKWNLSNQLFLYSCFPPGCTYVLHTASPFPIDTPKDPENELYKPAVNGTLNVMKVMCK